MTRFDIMVLRFLLIGGGMVIVVVEILLLVDEWLTGGAGWMPAWARCLVVLVGMGLILVSLAVRARGSD